MHKILAIISEEDKDKGILELSFKDILPEAFTGKDLTSDDKQEE